MKAFSLGEAASTACEERNLHVSIGAINLFSVYDKTFSCPCQSSLSILLNKMLTQCERSCNVTKMTMFYHSDTYVSV